LGITESAFGADEPQVAAESEEPARRNQGSAPVGESKKQETYRKLRRAIINGELRPGDVITEGKVASRFGFSKAPVREALGWLAFEGLLQPLPRFGYLVTSLTIRDVQEAYHLRELLEAEAVRLAADRITPEQVALLDANLAQQDSTYGLAENRQFHLTIARASGNRRLERLIEQLLDDMERILTLDPALDPAVSPVREGVAAENEHRILTETLRRRDGAAAQAAVHAEFERSRARVLERFPKEQTAPRG
jgi:DNA-binding GntR family transcriptional regulator